MNTMRMIIATGVGLSLLCASGPYARSEWDNKADAWDFRSVEYCFQRISDTTSDLWLVHSNRMAIGRPFLRSSPFPDDDEQVENLSYTFDASFPGGSRKDYLYAAGLWVGGVKGNDTLVSHAFDYVSPVPELNPLPCPEGAFQSFSGWADREYIAVAFDTIVLGDTLYRCQVGDCNDWIPLGIKVTSHSYTWESPPYDRSTIVEYTIRNIDTLPLTSGWVGVYADCDIGMPSDAYADDVSGFLKGAVDSAGVWVDLDVAYSHDMDGDPTGYVFDGSSTTGAFGIQVLGLSAPDYRVNFNWWTGGGISSEWAPRQEDSVIRDLGGSYAAAYGDSNKYFVMSYPEIDYNQIESGIPHVGWIDPDEVAVSAALGLDTRFLISAGPFDLAPQDSVTFAVAYIAGDHAITNGFIDIWFDPQDPLAVSDYYEVLNLEELQASALAAYRVFRDGFDLPPPGPPGDFRLVEYDDTYGLFSWSSKSGYDVAGYHLMRRTEETPWEIIEMLDITDTTALVDGLDPDTQYIFAVASFDSGSAAGIHSPIVRLLPGLPHAPAALSGSGGRLLPYLSWNPSPDPDVDNYRVYRIAASSPADTVLVAEMSDTVFIDYVVHIVQEYEYFVTAVAASGLESMPSASISLIPMMGNAGVLAANINVGAVMSNLLFDASFFEDLMSQSLDGIPHTYRTVDTVNPLTMEELVHYSLVIISSENRSGSLSLDLASLLRQYMSNGGKVIMLVRHTAFAEGPTANPKIRRFSSDSFLSSFFKIDSSYIGPIITEPGPLMIGDLTGAMPETAAVPALHWDSTRINQFAFEVPYGIPYTGYIWPHEPAEIIYRYESANPDSVIHGQVNGIRYRGDDYAFYYLNFPLSLMEVDSAAALIRNAVIDLGEHYICGDVSGNLVFNIGDVVAYIHYLYGGLQPPALELAGDVDCNGLYEMTDILILINYFMRSTLAPTCCQ